METQQKIIISEVTQRNKRLKTSALGGYMPTDLLFEIFLRLPTKSIARCRCVSKLWSSLLSLPSFTELFLTRSSARPGLLFACHNGDNNEVVVYFCTQPHSVDHEKLSFLTVSHHIKISYYCELVSFNHIKGLIFLVDKRVSKGRVHNVSMICNPSTGQSWTLPKLKSRRRVGVRSYMGYDPVEKQYKVLSMTWKITTRDVVCEEHQVMTLGTTKPSWRMIECPIPHSCTSRYNQICINGVLYYTAFEWIESSRGNLIIVCFDIKSEKFSFARYMQTTPIEDDVSPLINCNGKLASLSRDIRDFVMGENNSITLWVLEDAEKQEWLKYTYLLPALWKNIVGNIPLRFVGMTQTKEIVLSTRSHESVPFYIVFYNTVRKTVTRVEIQGMETFKPEEIYTYLDHIEDVKLMRM